MCDSACRVWTQRSGAGSRRTRRKRGGGQEDTAMDVVPPMASREREASSRVVAAIKRDSRRDPRQPTDHRERRIRRERRRACTLVFGFLVSQSLCACTWPGSVPPAPPRLWAAAAPHLWSEASGPTRRRPWVRGSRGEYSSSALGPLQRLERNSRRDPLGGLSPSVRLLCASTVAGESQGSGWGVS